MAIRIPIYKLCICWADVPDGPQQHVVVSPGGQAEADLKRLFLDEIAKENPVVNLRQALLAEIDKEKLGVTKTQAQAVQAVTAAVDRALAQLLLEAQVQRSVAIGIDRALDTFKKSAFGL